MEDILPELGPELTQAEDEKVYQRAKTAAEKAAAKVAAENLASNGEVEVGAVMAWLNTTDLMKFYDERFAQATAVYVGYEVWFIRPQQKRGSRFYPHELKEGREDFQRFVAERLCTAKDSNEPAELARNTWGVTAYGACFSPGWKKTVSKGQDPTTPHDVTYTYKPRGGWRKPQQSAEREVIDKALEVGVAVQKIQTTFTDTYESTYTFYEEEIRRDPKRAKRLTNKEKSAARREKAKEVWKNYRRSK